jgi:uncharacterized protein with von Willebrand factor type A (vWA) domain
MKMNGEEVKGKLLFLLDGSGSMSGDKEVTLEALNEYVNSLRKENLEFTLVVWDNTRYLTVYHGDIKDTPLFKVNDYRCEGMTPLLDTVGRALSNFQHKLGKKLLTVMTDGHENCSQEYTTLKIHKMITEFKSKGNEVYFLGAKIDAWEAAQHLGISQSNAISYAVADSKCVYRGLSMETQSYFSGNPTSYSDSDE